MLCGCFGGFAAPACFAWLGALALSVQVKQAAKGYQCKIAAGGGAGIVRGHVQSFSW